LSTPIDRQALVRRHSVVLTAPDPEHVLTVGNGDFAYSADVTGMQTFIEFHDPLAAAMRRAAAVNTATMSTWGWHEMPNPHGFVLDDAMSRYETPRGPVLYPDRYDMRAAMSGQVQDDYRAGTWLHENPQRIDLGRIGLALRAEPGAAAVTDPHELQNVHQELDPWTGTIESSFSFAGEQVAVTTVASPDSSTVAFRIVSDLLRDGRAQITLSFPYAHAGFFQTSDWNAADHHSSTLASSSTGNHVIDRVLDDTAYRVELAFTNGTISLGKAPHTFVIAAAEGEIELVARFAPSNAKPDGPLDDFRTVIQRASESWQAFWTEGAAIDFSGSTDPRATELERRIVLSQYHTAVNCSGIKPPQETGLITNSWQGKSHLEMHFWHAAHFATWGRPQLLERSLGWYREILHQAQSTATRQHYPGARWPKQVGPEGRESPEPIGSLLIWQQPHILYLLELVWRASAPDHQSDLVNQFAELVEETAAFMVAFADERDGSFHLGPPVMPAQEFYDAATTEDPTFELAYWWWGVEIAQRWRERAGVSRHDQWTSVQEGMARPHIIDGHYSAVAGGAEMRRDDHPSLLAALGVVPETPVIDRKLMESTLLDVLGNWDWPSAWGWDFPVLAMTATRLGRPDLAIDALLRDEVKNHYNVVGHNPQMRPILPIYLPGNGALLTAVSLMAQRASDGSFRGFPAVGWSIQTEGFTPWP
jgi:hypothetical protein